MTPKKKADDAVGPVEPVQTTQTTALQAVEGAEFDDSPPAPVITNEPQPEQTPNPPASGPRHALDDAPIHSKIVKTLDGAWLATPDGSTRLKPTDMASRLPDGAKITKLAAGKYRATQLSAAEDHPDFDALTAYEAIQRFVPHFHGGEAVR